MSHNGMKHLIEVVKSNKIPKDLRNTMIELIESQIIKYRYDLIEQLPEQIRKHTAKLEQIIAERNIKPVEHEFLIDTFQDFVWTLKSIRPDEIDIDAIFKQLEERKELQTFLDFPYPTINAKTDGLHQGLCIFAGASNIGKTAILHNLVASWVIEERKTMPDILYISLDDTIPYTVNRINSIISKIPTTKLSGRQGMTAQESEMALGVQNALREYHKTGKLVFCDISNAGDSQSFEFAIKKHCEMSEMPVVIVDGTYNLKMSRRGFNLRQEAIELFNFLKEMADKYEIPLIMTGEVPKDKNKADAKNPLVITDLLETGKAIYNAAYVFTCYPFSYEHFAATENDSYILCLDLVKNKRGRGKGLCTFQVERNCLSMKATGAPTVCNTRQNSDDFYGGI